VAEIVGAVPHSRTGSRRPSTPRGFHRGVVEEVAARRSRPPSGHVAPDLVLREASRSDTAWAKTIGTFRQLQISAEFRSDIAHRGAGLEAAELLRKLKVNVES